MDRNGLIKLKFNKKIQIPSFATGGRRLNASDDQTLALRNLDVQRDLLNLDFLLKSDVEPKDVEYSLELKKWKEDYIHI